MLIWRLSFIVSSTSRCSGYTEASSNLWNLQGNKSTGFCLSSSQATMPDHRVPSGKKMCKYVSHPMWCFFFQSFSQFGHSLGPSNSLFLHFAHDLPLLSVGKLIQWKLLHKFSELELPTRNLLSSWTKKTRIYETIRIFKTDFSFVDQRTREPWVLEYIGMAFWGKYVMSWALGVW